MRKGNDLLIKDEASVFRVRLAQAMEHDSVSKKELAKRINVTLQAVSQFMGGHSTPTMATAVRIAKALNVSLDWLCGLED